MTAGMPVAELALPEINARVAQAKAVEAAALAKSDLAQEGARTQQIEAAKADLQRAAAAAASAMSLADSWQWPVLWASHEPPVAQSAHSPALCDRTMARTHSAKTTATAATTMTSTGLIWMPPHAARFSAPQDRS